MNQNLFHRLVKIGMKAPVLLSALPLLTFFSACLPSLAQDQAGSMESIWNDESVKDRPGDQAQASPPNKDVIVPQDARTQLLAPKSSSREEKGGAQAPPVVPVYASMSSLADFTQTDLIKKEAWPGIGPFKTSNDEPTRFVDDNRNVLKVILDGPNIAQAELSLALAPRDFLDLQMSCDFFLESLGARAKSIVAFNQDIEKSEEELMSKSGSEKLDLACGHYLVNIKKAVAADTQDAKKFDLAYVISVNSRDASKQTIQEHFTPKGEEEVSLAKHGGKFDFFHEHGKAPPAGAETPEELKADFLKTIQTWQTVKKAAVRDRKVPPLSTVLAGKALSKQADAIKWLAKNHKYFEMNPESVAVDHYVEIQPGKKYTVYADVRESTQYVDELTAKVLKESDEMYNVTYTMEKIGQGWYIVDSQVLSSKTLPKLSRSQNVGR